MVKKNGKQIIKEDNIVRAINAMNSSGFMKIQAKFHSSAAGARAHHAKAEWVAYKH